MTKNRVEMRLVIIGLVLISFYNLCYAKDYPKTKKVRILEAASGGCMLTQEKVLKITDVLSKQSSESINKNTEYFMVDKETVKTFLIDIIILLIIVILVLIINIFQGRKTENLLRKSEREYKELLMGIPNSVILIANKELKFINQHGIDFLGETADNKITYSILKEIFIKDIDFDNIDTIPKHIKTEIRTLHNEIKEVELIIVVKNKASSAESIIILIQDISHRKLLYESTERDRIRSEFIANLSHELKTPINLIATTSQLLEQMQSSEKDLKRILPKSIRILNQNVYRLMRLVNNIIDSTMIGSGYVKLNLHNCNIIEITEEITLSAVSYARAQNIELLFDTELEELKVALDMDKYERIILNLISNAIKYNRTNGQILVYMYTHEEKIAISVKDTGIGINAKVLPYIFEQFMQVNKSLVRDAEGSGIGLTLVKSFTQLHGGKIEVNSREGEGTEFIVHLPIYTLEDDKYKVSERVLSKNKNRRTKIELSDIYVKDYAS